MKKIASTKKVKTIGILGGMGPVSSAHFYSEILRICQQEFGAMEDWDFPRILLHSLPLPELTRRGFSTLDALPSTLIPTLRSLETSGADFVVIPCNTTHYFLRQMRASIEIPIISIIDCVIHVAMTKRYKKVGLIGTETTVKTGLYNDLAQKKGIEILSMDPLDYETVGDVIIRVAGGLNTDTDTRRLREVAERLFKRGADAVILGCTELPIALTSKDTDIPLLDSASILARASVHYAYGKK